MFDINADDIRLLGDADLRELTARLCEAEVAKFGFSTTSVTWGGHQNAADAGIDVRIDFAPAVQINGWIPRPATGFQVKKTSMPRAKILKEMRPKGIVRDVIADLTARSGAYIIVSSEDVTDKVLRNRRAAMREAVRDLAGSDAIALDFYDRRRLATWAQDHPGVILWVRERIGRVLKGWRPLGPWADVSEEASGEYLSDERLRIHLPTRKIPEGVSAMAGLEEIRNTLRQPQGIVRLVGLSGTGKTRLAQALFQKEIGKDSLHPSVAAYTDVANSPEPTPTDLASQLVAAGKRAILIIDNCPPDLHGRLSQICRAPGSKLSAVTIEYDIREDVPEGTEVFRLDTSSRELIEKLVRRRFAAISATDAKTIANFSDGNARVAMALAWTLRGNETIAGLSDNQLLQRLIQQRHAHDPAILLASEACSLVYSFDGESVGNDAELARLGALIGQSAHEVFRHVAAVLDRGLVQRRGIWRAVLPQAIANRLAANALKKIPSTTIEEYMLRTAPERVLRSFTRRLGYLDSSPEAAQMSRRWLGPAGPLGDLFSLDQVHRAAFENIAPVLPEATLETIERALGAIDDAEILRTRKVDVPLLRKLAYEARMFSRCTALLGKIALAVGVGEGSNRALEAFKSLFQVGYSGTHASIEQRLAVIEELFSSARCQNHALGLQALDSVLSTYLRPFGDFEFGSRSRDYGFWPRSSDEWKHWFALALALARRVACSVLPIAADVRHVVADHLRGIWLLGCAHDEIADTCFAISDHSFWPEGWFAIRQSQFHEGAGFTPEISSRLASIEDHLRPRDLAQEVRAIVLSKDHAGLYTTENPDRLNDVSAGLARISNLSVDLGKAVAIDEKTFEELLPEIVRGDAGHLWNFGMGLARGSVDPRGTWRRLLETLLTTPESERQIQILRGFVRELSEMNPALTEEMLDALLGDARLIWLLPALQAAAGVGQRGAERLITSLSLGTVPIKNYGWLTTGATDTISALALTELVLQMASKPNGFSVAAEILHARLREDKNSGRGLSSEIIAAGRELIRKTPFSTTQIVMLDYNLGEIAQACLGGALGEQVVQEVLQRLKREVSAYRAYASNYDDLVLGLFAASPVAALDALCGGSMAELQYGIGIIRDHQRNPIDAVPAQELLAWCDQDANARYPATAEVITMFGAAKDNEFGPWSKPATRLLERAPDRIAVLQQYVNRIEDVGRFELRAASLESAAKVLSELPTVSDSELSGRVAEEVDRLHKAAETQRQAQAEELLRGDNRFE